MITGSSKLTSNVHARQGVKFALVGILNALVGLSAMYALMYLGVEYRIANAIGYGLGFVNSFFFNRSWTFRHSGKWHLGLARWAAVAAVAYGCNLAVVVAAHRVFGLNAYLAQITGMFAYTGVSFLGGKFFAFAPSST